MKRGGPLKRYARLAPKRAKPRRQSAVRDAGYLTRVRELPCCVCATTIVARDAHHAGLHVALGRKPDDTTAVPLCRWCHDSFHRAIGFFRFMDRGERREWADEAIAKTRAAVEALRRLAA